MADQNAVLAALRTVNDPELHRDIVSLNMVRDLTIDGPTVRFSVVLTTPACPLRETIDKDVREALIGIGVDDVHIDWGAEVRTTSRPDGPRKIEGVRNVIAVASNKGGVGKSSVSVNLAVALARLGAHVGLLDADITGPNIPTMLGIDGGLQASGQNGLQTVETFGIKAVSIGFVLPKGTPVVWRGPMIGTGVRQLMHDVDWGDLDYLVIDLPPGTSDASMTMAQDALIAGAVIVSTPSKVSIEDAQKAVGMFDRLGIPVFGIIENMSSDVFGRGGARQAADDLGLEFLGELPLDARIREGGDGGVPVVVGHPESEIAQAFIHLAEQVAARCSVLQFAGEAGVR
ncbi:MAG: iron-sulfur cluster carrier protein ApbC [Dehalococcoidia bacterium]|nr:iron-sulfur cluster carrier protein ApbC [Dehalococcoidia bacterium]